MKQAREGKKRGSSFQQRLALGLIFVLVFTYTVYHLTSLFGTEISTFAAGVTTESTVLSYNGYVFRDEVVLTSDLGGVVDYHVSDGTKVAKDQTVATVYELGDAAARERLRAIDDRLAVLEQSTGDHLNNLDIGEVKEQVSGTYNTLVKMLAAGDTGGLSYQADQLLIGMNRLDGLTARSSAEETVATSEETLAEVRAYREELLAAAGDSADYSAARSGYFYSRTDGYESIFTAAAARDLSGDRLYALLSKMTPASSVEGETAYGKLCYSSEWHLVLPVSPDDLEYFEVGETYHGLFEENNRTEIPLTLERSVESSSEDVAFLVFLADRLPNRFSFDRTQSVRLEVDSISGIYVPKDVVTRVDGYRGVYTLRGSVVHFRYIEILYEGSDYYLVKENVEGDGEHTYLQVNDLIILNGKNMFDGRVLD